MQVPTDFFGRKLRAPQGCCDQHDELHFSSRAETMAHRTLRTGIPRLREKILEANPKSLGD